jgi:hypothetical protein
MHYVQFPWIPLYTGFIVCNCKGYALTGCDYPRVVAGSKE